MEIEIREAGPARFILGLTQEVISCEISVIITSIQQILLKNPKELIVSIDASTPDENVVSGLIVLLHSHLGERSISLSIIEKSGRHTSLCEALFIPIYSDEGVCMLPSIKTENNDAIGDVPALVYSNGS